MWTFSMSIRLLKTMNIKEQRQKIKTSEPKRLDQNIYLFCYKTKINPSR